MIPNIMDATNYARSSYQSAPDTSDNSNGKGKAPLMCSKSGTMWQFFHTKVDDVVLFEGWKIDSAGTMALACAITFLVGIAFEFVKWARKRAIADLKLRRDPNASPTPIQALFAATHLVGTLFFALQLSIGYLLMLIVMTFSVWLGLSVVVGATLGFIIFGDRN